MIFPPVYFTGGLVDCQPSIGKIMVRKPTTTGLLTGGGRFSLTVLGRKTKSDRCHFLCFELI